MNGGDAKSAMTFLVGDRVKFDFMGLAGTGLVARLRGMDVFVELDDQSGNTGWLGSAHGDICQGCGLDPGRYYWSVIGDTRFMQLIGSKLVKRVAEALVDEVLRLSEAGALKDGATDEVVSLEKWLRENSFTELGIYQGFLRSAVGAKYGPGDSFDLGKESYRVLHLSAQGYVVLRSDLYEALLPYAYVRTHRKKWYYFPELAGHKGELQLLSPDDDTLYDYLAPTYTGDTPEEAIEAHLSNERQRLEKVKESALTRLNGGNQT